MKNKAKLLLAGIFVSGMSLTANAQTLQQPPAKTGFYIGVGGGYNLPITSKTFGGFDLYEQNDPQNGPDTYKNKGISLGKGANFGIDLGYMFTPNIGAELGIDYLLGSNINNYKYTEEGYDYTENQHLKAKMLQFKPAVVFKAGSGNINPYAKVGVVVGVGTKITSEYEEREPSTNYTYDRYREYNGGTAIGFHGALGIDYAINNNVSLFGEVTGVSLNYAPTKGKVTRLVVDGVDRLPNLDVIDREWEYVDSMTDDDNENDNQPRKEMKFSTPFSSVGLNIGAKFRF